MNIHKRFIKKKYCVKQVFVVINYQALTYDPSSLFPDCIDTQLNSKNLTIDKDVQVYLPVQCTHVALNWILKYGQ